MTLNPIVGLGQFLAAPGDVQANLDFLGRLDKAGPEGLDPMCFPELRLPGYLLDAHNHTASLARDLRRTEEAIQGVADAADVRIVYGTARWVADRLHNCVVLAEPHAGATTYNNMAVSTVAACVPDTRVQGVLACLADRSVLLRSLRREEECVAYAPAYTETEAIQIELDGLTRNTFRMS